MLPAHPFCIFGFSLWVVLFPGVILENRTFSFYNGGVRPARRPPFYMNRRKISCASFGDFYL